ncbi:MAG: lytic murein transglycosylase [Chromatiales bacterium]|jgi:lytic murein transglycosylase
MHRKFPGLLALPLLFCSMGAMAENDRNCRNSDDFSSWLNLFEQEARTLGISERTLDIALGGLVPDEKIIRLDRKQHVFSQDFLTFAGRMVNDYRLSHGAKNIRKYGDTFARIEQDFGVPAAVISAFWALETDFGANTGNMPTIPSLATLAWDCRRPDLFREQLLAALRIIDRGDLGVDEMRGAWAGELGQTQFLPAEYFEKGVDYDGDGRVDLIRSTPDALASTARVISDLGWQTGQLWLEEVRITADLPWEETGTDIMHSRAQWADWGVTKADGMPLPRDGMQASLLLLMGRNGPAFLAYPNFIDVYLEWNNSLVYATTAAYLATRLAGAGKVRPGRGAVSPLTLDQIKQLQSSLEALGHDVGGADGIIGAKTRAAIRHAQLELGLPADSYPDRALLENLHRLEPLEVTSYAQPEYQAQPERQYQGPTQAPARMPSHPPVQAQPPAPQQPSGQQWFPLPPAR